MERYIDKCKIEYIDAMKEATAIGIGKALKVMSKKLFRNIPTITPDFKWDDKNIYNAYDEEKK